MESAESMDRNGATTGFSFLDLKLQFASIREELMSAVARVMESQQFILGAEVAAFEKEIGGLTGCEFAVGCASGSDALLLALTALDLGSEDEVITTPFTFVATAGSIARAGAKPVFADIDSATYNIDPNEVARAITPRTRAIVPVHLFGLPADMGALMEISRNRNLPVVEDAAQAIGAQYSGANAGSMGSAGCFSFFPSKNLGGAGDGGMVVTRDPSVAERLRLLRSHGSRTKYHYEILGMNSRLDALQAAILRVKLRRLPEWSAARRSNADRYRFLFTEYGLGEVIALPFAPEGSVHVYNQFVIRCERRNELQAFLRQRGIPTEIYYPSPLHLQPAFASLGYRPGDFPAAERAAAGVLALPIYPELTERQQRLIVESIAEFVLAEDSLSRSHYAAD